MKDWHQKQKEKLTFGERTADLIRDKMGSWPFVFVFAFIMVAWMSWNLWSPDEFDKYPFILLNLGLSTLAGIQGAILLIAAKRTDQIAREHAKHDSDTILANNKKLDKIIDDVEEIKNKMV